MSTVVLGLPGGPRMLPGVRGDRPDDARLIDRFGRVATDLRVSLTDRCTLRCSYCMPPEGLDWIPGPELLTDDEIIRLITVAVERLGIREVRFTGGEPLLRRGLEHIVAATTALRTDQGDSPDTAVTTNGLGLAQRAKALRDAGLRRINVSLDTLDQARFARITHRDRLPEVLAGLRAATAAGLAPIKVNTVLLRGVNDDEAVDLVRWAMSHGYHLRFIEQMPLDPQGAWDREQMVTADQILQALRPAFTLTAARPGQRGSAPAQLWQIAGGDSPDGRPADVGIVASVTRPFCGDCDRARLTADGQLRTCLFAREETDLRTLLRAGATDEELAASWRTSLWSKQAGHGIDDPSFLRPDRPMSAIGG